MKPYSLDLRIRVIQAYEKGEGSIRDLARRFEVHWRTVSNWITRFRQENSAGPRIQSRCGPAPKLDESGLEILQKLVKDEPGLTLSERCVQLQHAHGVVVSKQTLSRVLARLRLTYKKNASSQRS